MTVRFAVKQVEQLCENLRSSVDEIRALERDIQDICVNKVKMPRELFLATFPGNESNPKWVEDMISTGKPFVPTLNRYQHAVIEKQFKLAELQK